MRIGPLAPEDRAGWEPLARGYKAFYKTEASPAEYDAAWARILERKAVFGIGAKVDGELVGIAHYLFHASAWAERVCYLQDLFVLPAARGRGIARSLIEAVAQAAREGNATRCYWHTQEGNATARALYDRVGRFKGFIRYDYPLEERRAP